MRAASSENFSSPLANVDGPEELPPSIHPAVIELKFLRRKPFMEGRSGLAHRN
jgi:hypothetical protein